MVATKKLLSRYKNKKVFLTGHTGFKGSWLAFWLHQLGANVKGYSLPPERYQRLFEVIESNHEIQSVFGNILHYQRLEKEMTDFQPDFVFHLAAQPLVRLSYEIPANTFEVNVVGTANLLSAVRQLTNPCAVVIITTDKVYDNKEWEYPYRENDQLGGYDPYSASKACAELVVASYRNSFFSPISSGMPIIRVASARAGNVIGGGDWAPDRIVPDCIRALVEKRPISVRNPSSIRPWQHVLEPLSGYLLLGLRLMESPSAGQAWNFGPQPEDHFPVIDLVTKSISIWGEGNFETPPLPNQPHEAQVLKLDISKSIEQLQWHPRWNGSEAIERTIGWYFQFLNGKPAAELMLNDINHFSN
ncbi:MAG: CDP-glucose 4,6-dehydratase [Flammeovirgaceae bacterium]|jgi:CDP-glucose 4,6-dehydratase|nr:CDP-glucose 4,6-dehydratase [Flammeovirgaceae bacterium]